MLLSLSNFFTKHTVCTESLPKFTALCIGPPFYTHMPAWMVVFFFSVQILFMVVPNYLPNVTMFLLSALLRILSVVPKIITTVCEKQISYLCPSTFK